MSTLIDVAKVSRRAVLGGTAAVAGAAAAGWGGYELLHKPGDGTATQSGGGRPNILVILVDQMRAPQWFPDTEELNALLPRLGPLHGRSVSVATHYSARS